MKGCKHFRDIPDFVESENLSLPLDFSTKAIEIFLYFFDTFTFDFPDDVKDTYTDLDDFLDAVRVADFLDLDYHRTLHKKDIINVFLDNVTKLFDIPYKWYYDFIKSVSRKDDEWESVIYALTHLEEWEKFEKSYFIIPYVFHFSAPTAYPSGGTITTGTITTGTII